MALFKQWLTAVDEPRKGEEFIEQVMKLCATIGLGLEERCDLAGANAVDVIIAFGCSISHKMNTFVHRATMQATKEFCAKDTPQMHTAQEAPKATRCRSGLG